MGFLDDAKSKLKNAVSGMGEETFDINDNPEKKARDKKSPTIPGFGKVKMKKDIDADKPINMDYNTESKFEETDNSNTYFDHLETQQQEYLDTFDDKHLIEVKDGRIQDVLYLLNIPETFELREFVLLPEDIDGINFDIQYPKGYEIGQVDNFLTQAKKTISELVKLLKLRNKHIAELATTVDRLQVDANNYKFDAQLANGINIMPTDDSDALQEENLNLRIYIKDIESELEKAKRMINGEVQDMSISDGERETLNQLKDEYSVLQIESNALKQENSGLRNQVAELIEDIENLEEKTPSGSFNNTEDDNSFGEFTGWEEENETNNNGEELSLRLEDFAADIDKPRNIPHTFDDEEDESEHNDDPMFDPSYEAPFGTQNFSGQMGKNAFDLDLSEFNGDFSNTSFSDKLDKSNNDNNTDFDFGDDSGIEFLDDNGNIK